MKTYDFSCGCSFPIDESLPKVHGRPAICTDPDNFPLTCPVTWEMISDGFTKGVFQLESQLGRTWSKKLRPGVPDVSMGVEHLSSLVSLLRPGCLKALDENGISMTEHYCFRKNGVEPTTYFHPSLEPILESTYGVLVYQEQAMDIVCQLAGFSLEEADELRKAMGKKKTDVMAQVKSKFSSKAEQAGIVSSEEASMIFSWIEQSQRYSFNKCVAFDTKLKRAAKSKFPNGTNLTVEEMYRIRNDINYAKAVGRLSLYKKWKLYGNYGKSLSLCDDDRLRPNTIRDIKPAGVRPVFEICLSNGATIKVTNNHKFPTPNNKETLVRDLRIGDNLYVCGEYEKCNKRYGYSDITQKELRKRKIGKAVNKCFGESNYGFTNGSYSQYQYFRESTPDICFDCNKRECRIETHHINGDRTNSSPKNLVKLCVSCHKKREYSTGRVRKGEKGYPSVLVEIISIVYIEDCMTYDITMDAPNHTFTVDSGIVTCNSHAMSYAITAYQTAYLKAHFPIEFFTSYLHYSKEKQKPLIEIRELINEAKLFNIEIEPPRFATMKHHFTNNGVKIRFGLSDVKGIGYGYIKKIRENAAEVVKATNRPVSTWTWYEFLTLYSDFLNKTAVTRMIEVGGLREYGLDRQLMLAEYETWNELTDKEKSKIIDGKLTSLVDGLKYLLGLEKGVHTSRRKTIVETLLKILVDPPRPLVDTPDWIAKNEYECLGIPITCTKLDDSESVRVNTTCKEYIDGKDIDFIVMRVTINTFKEITIKNGDSRGRKMAFLTVSDQSGSLDDIVVFADSWEKYNYLMYDGNSVELAGCRDKKRGSFIVEQVWQI